ncbi:MAG: hypothetical protein RLZZ254_1122 [Actinomycetota bacterium]|jgi:hypothetical protein
MKQWQRIAFATLGALGMAVLGSALTFLFSSERSEDSRVVEKVDLRDVSIVGSSVALPNVLGVTAPTSSMLEVSPESPAVGAVRQRGYGVVPGLRVLSGIMSLRGEDLFVNDQELDFGPDSWIESNQATADLDGNGALQSLWREIRGLIGKRVDVLGEMDDGDFDVFEINGVALRPLYSLVAPWSSDWDVQEADGVVDSKMQGSISADEAMRIALDQIPGVVVGAHIDVNDGHPYWELDVRRSDGAMFDVEIDAVTGKVIEIDRN